jgi:hypothetical protein
VSTISVEGSGYECDVELDVWLRDLMPLTPGCVPKVRKRALILACREFFEQSAAWRVTIGPKQLQAGRKRYILSPYDAYTDIVQVLRVELNGRPLRPYASQPTKNDISDLPRGYWLEAPDTVRPWPVPITTVPDALTFYVALAPKQSVTHLPRVAATHFYDAIFDGAAGRLLSQPAKPYSNPTIAMYHLKRFRDGIGKAAARAKSGFSSAPTWAFPKFGK